MPANDLRLWNARTLDPGSCRVLDRATIAIERGVITEVAEATGTTPDGAVDVAGRTVMPGLIDAHTHVSSDVSRSPGFGPPAHMHGEDPRPRELGWFVLAKTATALLDMGLTSVRDVGAYDAEAIVLRRAIELEMVTGPRLLSCGRIISATSPGGRMFGTMYEEADGPWEMRRAVRRQLRRGADFVKLMSTGARSVEREDPRPAQMTREEMSAIVDEAHRIGLRVAAHAEGLEGTRFAIEEGVDTIEHGMELHHAPELLAAMAERGQVLVPTLTTFHDLAERFSHEWVPRLVDQAKRQLEDAYLTLAAARDAGVTMAVGFDSGPPGSNAWELVRMAEGGLGSAAGLGAATRGGAAALGRSDLGRLEVGAAGDLIVLDGDPLADVRLMLRPAAFRLVISGGRVVAGRDLDGPRVGPQAQAVAEVPADGPPSPCMHGHGGPAGSRRGR